jgi:hypothetical protein
LVLYGLFEKNISLFHYRTGTSVATGINQVQISTDGNY